jgi:hypothetical protein
MLFLMKLLMFQAKRFRYRTFEKTLEQVPDLDLEEEIHEAAVYGESLAKVFKAL